MSEKPETMSDVARSMFGECDWTKCCDDCDPHCDLWLRLNSCPANASKIVAAAKALRDACRPPSGWDNDAGGFWWSSGSEKAAEALFKLLGE